MLIKTGTSALTRRSLLEAGIASGLLGMSGAPFLVPGARAAEQVSEEILTGSHWGAFRMKVSEGRIVGIRPWENDPRPAATLEGILDSVYSPTRIRYPMVRRAYLEHGPGTDPDGRGDGDYVRVSWDQALNLVVAELKRVAQNYGPTATFAGSYGWMSPGKLHNCQALLRTPRPIPTRRRAETVPGLPGRSQRHPHCRRSRRSLGTGGTSRTSRCREPGEQGSRHGRSR